MNSFGKTLILIAGFAITCAAPIASAQIGDSTGIATTDSIVEVVRSAYQRLDYETAEAQAVSALDQFQRFNSGQLVELNVILALIKYARNDTESSKRFFLSALSLDHTLEMDPLLVSPKILSFFREVKSESVDLRALNTNSESTYVRYLLLQDARPGAALRSMIVPGWGHLYLGRPSKGRLLLGAWAFSVVGTVVTHFVRKDAEADYLEETNPDRVGERYDRFNTWNRTRNGFALGAAVIWTYSYIDILSSRPSGVTTAGALHLGLKASPQSLAVGIRF